MGPTRRDLVHLQVKLGALPLVLTWLLAFASPAHGQASDHVGQVVVRVREQLTENPLAQVSVKLVRFPDGILAEQFTGSDGGVQFSGIPVGGYTIRATLQGFQPGEAHVDFRKGDSTLQSVDISLEHVEKGSPKAARGSVSAKDLQIPDSAQKEFERGERLLNDKKSPRDSISALQRAIKIFPDYADAYFLLGTAQMQINEAAAAEDSLHKAIAIDARRTAPYYPLAMLLFSQRRFDDERQLLLAVNNLDPTDWRWPFELARCEAQQGHWEPALRSALEASKNAGAPTRVHLMLADIYANANRPRDAVTELELFAQLDPQSPYMDRVREVLPVLRQRVASSASQP